jgi:hypothetical protein
VKHLSLAAPRKSGRDFAVGTVSLVTGRYAEWTPGDAFFTDKLIASASIPVVFPFVDLKRARDVLVDGGVRNMAPLSSAFGAEPDELYVLLTSRVVRQDDSLPNSAVQEQLYSQWDDNWLGTKVGRLDALKRTVEILTDEVYLDDLSAALSWNEILGAAARVVEAAREQAAAPAQRVDGVDGAEAAGSQLAEAPGGQSAAPGLKDAVEELARSVEQAGKRSVPIYVLAPRQWYGERNDSTNFSARLIAEAIAHARAVAADPSPAIHPSGSGRRVHELLRDGSEPSGCEARREKHLGSFRCRSL